MKYQIEKLVQAALATLPPDILPADIVRPVVDVERTRDAAHGDFATNVAMQLAKPARRNPRQLAQAIVEALPASELVEQPRSPGPGFINFHLSARRISRSCRACSRWARCTGTASAAAGASTVVEFVSANPTGRCTSGTGDRRRSAMRSPRCCSRRDTR